MPASPYTSPWGAGAIGILAEESPLHGTRPADRFWSKRCFLRLAGVEDSRGRITWETWKSVYSDSKNKYKLFVFHA